MHVHIWCPGHLVDTKKDTIQLMNSMCDYTKLVISPIVRNINLEILAKTSMEKVALLVVINAVLVVDTDRKCITVFEYMCTQLKIHLFPLAQGNHKRTSVDKYILFLNRTQTIMG